MSQLLLIGYIVIVSLSFRVHSFFAIIFCFSFLNVSVAADESTCPTVRLDKNGGPFEKLPVYDQNRSAKDDTSLCYATTASLLIDANRFLRGEEVPPFTAPLSVSLNYKMHQSKLPLDQQDPINPSDPSMLAYSLVGGGFIDTAIEANRGQNVCDQRFLQSFDDTIGNTRGGNAKFGSPEDSTTENFLKNILDQTDKFRRDSQFIDRVNTRAESLNDFFRCRTTSGLSNVSDILEAAKAAHLAASPLNKAEAFVAKLCQKNSFTIQIPKAQKLDGISGDYLKENMELVKKLGDPNISAEQRKQLIQDFQERFDANNKIEKLNKKINTLLQAKVPMPVGIGYCHDSLTTKEEANCAPAHASVIVGRRFNFETKTCEFLVRDSYGPNCNDVNGKARYSWPCENGSVWIDSRKLLRSASSITWIPVH